MFLKTAIDYVNPYVQQMYPGARDPWYREDELTSVDRFILEAIGELYMQGYRLPPRGREPVAIYQQAEAYVSDKVTLRVYMAMLDNPPKQTPTPPPVGERAEYKNGWNDALAYMSAYAKNSTK